MGLPMIRMMLISLLFVTSCKAEIDSSQAIQDQIDWHSEKQIPYTLPEGRSYLYSPLIIRTNTTINGTGPTFGTVLQPMGESSAIIIDGGNVEGGWAFRNTLNGFTIDASQTTAPEVIKIKKAYSTKINSVFIYNQNPILGVSISESNHIQLNEVVMYGESKANKTGLLIEQSSVTINDVDLENYSRCLINNSGQLTINSPYMERCVVNIEHRGGSTAMFGGLLKSINGYNIGLKGNDFNSYGTVLQSYSGSGLDQAVTHCFNQDYLNVRIQGTPRYDGYLSGSNCINVIR